MATLYLGAVEIGVGYTAPSDFEEWLSENGNQFTNCNEPVDLSDIKLTTKSVTGNLGKSLIAQKFSGKTVPQFDTSSVTSMNYMFFDCSSLTSVPQFDTSSVTSMDYMFFGCSSLTSVPQFDTSSVTSMNYMFFDCSSLTEIHMKGMRVNLDLSATNLGHDACVEVINNLGIGMTDNSSRTLTLPKGTVLTDAEKKVATDKGWIVAIAL